jgi:formylglycine-generating enzyme required for sulfatase activity
MKPIPPRSRIHVVPFKQSKRGLSRKDSITFHVNRGGSWYCYASSCRSADRNGYAPGYHNSDLGFRLALSPVR